MKKYEITYVTKENIKNTVEVKAKNAIQASDAFFKIAHDHVGANILEIKENEIMSKEVMRNPADIAAEINAIKSQTSGILEAAFTYAKRSCFEIGKRLEEAKAAVPFGEWGEWLEKNVSYSVSTANDLMRIYREFGDEQINMLTGKSDAEIFEGLSQSQMVALFGLPKAMRAEFVEEHREELESGEMSTRKMKEEIKRLNDVIEQKDKEIRDNDESYAELVAQNKSLEKAHVKLQLRFDELNERPLETTKVTETVYEASPEQIEEIRAAAIKETEDKHARDAEKLQAEADKAQAEVDKLKEKIKKAGEADEKKIDELEKKLAAKDAELDAKIKEAVDAATADAKKQIRQMTAQADPRAAKVSYCLESIGRAMTDINNVVAAMNAESAGSGDQLRMKCESALLGLVNKLGWQI